MAERASAGRSEDMSDVVVQTADGVREIVLNRPARKNALTVAMYAEMADALGGAARDDSVRAVLVRGEGGTFTSGNDLGDFVQHPPSVEASPVLRFIHGLIDFDKPLVAAVEGRAIGIGVTMLLHCDLVYAAADARLSLPFVNLALVPEAGSSVLLPRLVGLPRAAELLFFGEPFDAAVGKELGLINAVLPAGEVVEHARARARALAEKPAEALRQTKRLLKAPLREEMLARVEAESAAFVERLSSPEVGEAIRAFFEKRAPRFGGPAR
jgi:enoyl-CoA hydratase/carnithine racemase